MLHSSLLVFGFSQEAQREAAAKLGEAQLLQERTERERDEARQGMAHAQVLLARALNGLLFRYPLTSLCSQAQLRNEKTETRRLLERLKV